MRTDFSKGPKFGKVYSGEVIKKHPERLPWMYYGKTYMVLETLNGFLFMMDPGKMNGILNGI